MGWGRGEGGGGRGEGGGGRGEGEGGRGLDGMGDDVWGGGNIVVKPLPVYCEQHNTSLELNTGV